MNRVGMGMNGMNKSPCARRIGATTRSLLLLRKKSPRKCACIRRCKGKCDADDEQLERSPYL